MSRFRPLRGRLWGVFDTPLRPGMCGPSKNYPVFVSFGAVCGAYAIRPYDRACAALQKNCPVFVPYGAACGAYATRPCNRVRAILRNTDAIPQLGTYGPSKNCPVFVPFGDACGAYAMRFPNQVRAILRNTDTISRAEGMGFLGGGAVGATACGGDGRE